MAITYKKIASVTVGAGGAANIEFTSIPGTYTDLVLFLSTRHDGATVANANLISLNSSTADFTNRFLQGDGASATSSTGTTAFGLDNGASSTTSTFSNNFIYFPNYAGSTNKSFSVDAVQETNATTSYMWLRAGLWSNTAAITSIKISPDNATRNYVQYSTATLYGILKA